MQTRRIDAGPPAAALRQPRSRHRRTAEDFAGTAVWRAPVARGETASSPGPNAREDGAVRLTKRENPLILDSFAAPKRAATKQKGRRKAGLSLFFGCSRQARKIGREHV